MIDCWSANSSGETESLFSSTSRRNQLEFIFSYFRLELISRKLIQEESGNIISSSSGKCSSRTQNCVCVSYHRVYADGTKTNDTSVCVNEKPRRGTEITRFIFSLSDARAKIDEGARKGGVFSLLLKFECLIPPRTVIYNSKCLNLVIGAGYFTLKGRLYLRVINLINSARLLELQLCR